MSKKQTQDIAAAVRNTALEQICAGLRRMGITEDEIAKTRKLCVEQGTDTPLLDLAKQHRKRP